MSTGSTLPPGLRAAIERDCAARRPLYRPARRALFVALPVLAAIGISAHLAGLGPSDLLTWRGGAVSLLEWLLATLLVWAALREAIPGLGLGARRAGALLAAGLGAQLGLGFLLAGSPCPMTEGVQCALAEASLALPFYVVALLLVLRALPSRPPWCGALAGAAAGTYADAVWHLTCPLAGLAHLLIWHFGVTAALAGLGFVGGLLWERRRRPAS